MEVAEIIIKYRQDIWRLLEHYQLEGHAVEIGVAEGRNAEVIAAWPQITKLYLIDNWGHLQQAGDGGFAEAWHYKNWRETRERMKRFPKAEMLKGKSFDMLKHIPDDSLIYAYVDCDHTEAGCLADLHSVWPKMKEGGIIAGHDVLNTSYGVRKAVEHFTGQRNIEWHIIEDEHPSMASFWFRK